MKTVTYETLDQIDRRILDVLAQDGRISVAELSRRVNLSKTPCQARITRLEKAGYILGYRAVIDPKRLGLSHVAFVEVKLSDTRKAALAAFNKAVRAIPEVERANRCASSFASRSKSRPRAKPDNRGALAERSSARPHVGHTRRH